MSDLIERQSAIDALGERPMVWTDDDEYSLGERNQYDIDRLAIETVPSAQPEPCEDAVSRMSDRYGYIAIETLLNFCENSKDHAVTPNDFMRMARVQVPDHLRESKKMMKRKRGKWVGNLRHQACSECHTTYCVPDGQDGVLDMTFYNYCPNCGADMREGEQDG